MSVERLAILLVEDDADDALVVQHALAEARFESEVVHVRCLADALEHLGARTFDALLLGLASPDAQGSEAQGLETVRRALAHAPGIPVLVLTSLDDESLAIQAAQEGVQDCLLKEHLREPSFPRAILLAIERKRSERERRALLDRLAIANAQRLSERTLRERERYYRSLLQTLPEDILVIDRERRITDCNAAFLRTTGRAREELLGRSCHEVLHGEAEPCARGGFLCPFPEVLATGRPLSRTRRYRDAEGRRVFASILFSPLCDESGAVTHVVEAIRDISELVETQAAFEERVRELHTLYAVAEAIRRHDDLPALFAAVVEILPQGARTPERAFARLLYDGAAYATAGFEDAAHHIEEALFVNEQERGSLALAYGLGSGEYAVDTVDPFHQSERTLLASLARTLGEALERRHVLAQLGHAQRLESVGRLAGGIAHDFNNLLTIIGGHAELATMATPEDSPNQKYLDEIQKATGRAVALTRQLLVFSRGQRIAPRVVDLNAAILATDRMLRRTLGADIELVTLPALEACPVRVDPSQLDQVLLNLAVNARDAMPGGGILTFEVAPARLDAAFCRGHPGATPGACAHLRVSDTGTGMSEETQRRIFEPFFTTKETGKGTGLGLATVYGIVKQNEGTIWCRSEEGRGTTFDIYLPHAEGPIEPIPRRGTSGKMLACGTETILVVEDEPNVRRVAVSVLRRQGYIVVEAENGEEALRLIEAEPARFRLVLTDVVMPRMGGKALAEAMRELTPEILVIYMSGYTDDEIVHHGVQGVSFLPKPFEVPALLQMVRSLLDAHPRAGA